jgi:hypothetical protein
MSANLHERTRADVDAHFAARIDRASETRMREHLSDCDECATYYDQHALLAELDPKAPSREARLLSALGVAPSRERRVPAWAFGGGFAVAACALLLILVIPREAPVEEGFTPRGAGTADLIVRRIDGTHSRPVGQTIPRNAELAFGYLNPTGRGQLLVFGVDEHRHVYWYHPTWTRAEDSPRAVPIEKTADALELKAATRHDLDGERLTLYGVFTDKALTVQEVEALLSAGGVEKLGEVVKLELTVDGGGE